MRQSGFRLDIESGEHELHLVAETAESIERNLELRRRRFAGHPADQYPIRTFLIQLDRVQPRGDIRPRITRTLDLVHQLCRNSIHRNRTTRALMLRDDAAAIPAHFGDRETGPSEIGQLGEECEVTAGGLRTALDDMSGHHRTGKLVVIGSPPTEMSGGRADDHGGVGDPTGNHDIGARIQTFDDAPGTEIGIRGQR